MKQIIIIIFFCSWLLSCADWQNVQESSSHRSDSFSPEQRQALFPNPLFVALVDKSKNQVLQEIIDQNGQYLFDVNANGDTALALAIKFYNLKGALFITKQLSPQHYLKTNHQGEGYIYLASQKGYVSLIKFLANGFFDNKQDFILSDYEFSDLDRVTHAGERAIHVAKNYITAEALKHEYWRGSFEYPFRKFQYLKNNKDQSILHTAVRDQNSDLLRWGLEQNCVKKEEWGHKEFYYKYPILFWRGVQRYGKPIGLDVDDLINTQDEEGMTAINFSAKNMFFDGIRILSSCQWTDYILPDNKGNTPLQNFLLTLDVSKSYHDEWIKEIFVLLMESQTRLTWLGIADHVNSINKQGESSLHISARLVDSFFYEQLKKYGDIEQVNHDGQTPKEIFQFKRQQLEGSI